MDNQAWLFAAGVAYGLAKDNNGAAALSGLLGLLIVEMVVGNINVISQITGVPVDQCLRRRWLPLGRQSVHLPVF